jgi:hypothetical protein
MWDMDIILWLLVFQLLNSLIVAVAGGCAAVTSEAFMNPFDGTTHSSGN